MSASCDNLLTSIHRGHAGAESARLGSSSSSYASSTATSFTPILPRDSWSAGGRAPVTTPLPSTYRSETTLNRGIREERSNVASGQTSRYWSDQPVDFGHYGAVELEEMSCATKADRRRKSESLQTYGMGSGIDYVDSLFDADLDEHDCMDGIRYEEKENYLRGANTCDRSSFLHCDDTKRPWLTSDASSSVSSRNLNTRHDHFDGSDVPLKDRQQLHDLNRQRLPRRYSSKKSACSSRGKAGQTHHSQLSKYALHPASEAGRRRLCQSDWNLAMDGGIRNFSKSTSHFNRSSVETGDHPDDLDSSYHAVNHYRYYPASDGDRPYYAASHHSGRRQRNCEDFRRNRYMHDLSSIADYEHLTDSIRDLEIDDNVFLPSAEDVEVCHREEDDETVVISPSDSVSVVAENRSHQRRRQQSFASHTNGGMSTAGLDEYSKDVFNPTSSRTRTTSIGPKPKRGQIHAYSPRRMDEQVMSGMESRDQPLDQMHAIASNSIQRNRVMSDPCRTAVKTMHSSHISASEIYVNGQSLVVQANSPPDHRRTANIGASKQRGELPSEIVIDMSSAMDESASSAVSRVPVPAPRLSSSSIPAPGTTAVAPAPPPLSGHQAISASAVGQDDDSQCEVVGSTKNGGGEISALIRTCRMSSRVIPRSLLTGYEDNHTIQISYHATVVISATCIERGEETRRCQINAYLPDTSQGRRLLAKFEDAFDRQLVLEARTSSHQTSDDPVSLRSEIAHWTEPHCSGDEMLQKRSNICGSNTLMQNEHGESFTTYLDHMEHCLDHALAH